MDPNKIDMKMTTKAMLLKMLIDENALCAAREAEVATACGIIDQRNKEITEALKAVSKKDGEIAHLNNIIKGMSAPVPVNPAVETKLRFMVLMGAKTDTPRKEWDGLMVEDLNNGGEFRVYYPHKEFVKQRMACRNFMNKIEREAVRLGMRVQWRPGFDHRGSRIPQHLWIGR